MFYRSLAVLLAVASFTGCKKSEVPRRLAALRFENLSARPDLDWVGRAISEEISGQLQGTRHQGVLSFWNLSQLGTALGPRPVAAPGVSAERFAAIGGGANRLLSGYFFARGDSITIQALEENVETRSVRQLPEVSGKLDDLLHLTDQIAKTIDEEAHPPITGSARALRSYALGIESPSDAREGFLTEAIRLDPNFGAPYVILARLAVVRRDNDAFSRIFALARTRGNGIPAVDRAVLNYEDARTHAPPAAQIDALGALARLSPSDPFTLRQLAGAEMAANRYSEAADHFRQLASLLPQDFDALNGLSYALIYSGDEPGAKKALDSYRAARPNDANPLDSLGDFHFFFGRFAEAEKAYLEAFEKDPSSISGGELLKAADARLFLRDVNGSAKWIARYRQARAEARDALADFHVAHWLRRAGKSREATALMSRYTQNAPEILTRAARAQIAWWQLIDAGGTGEAPDPNFRDAVRSVVQRDWAIATPLWKKIAESSPPTEWWTRAVYGRVLAESGRQAEAAPFLKFTPIPQPAQAVTFDDLWMPWWLQGRKTNQAGSVEKAAVSRPAISPRASFGNAAAAIITALSVESSAVGK